MKTNNKKGFTLVELVIVIAVIAILSAILVPTFGTVISNANETKRQEDARTAYQNFLTDFVKDDVAAGTAYILVEVTPEDAAAGDAITATKYLYKVDNGELKAEDKPTESGKSFIDTLKTAAGNVATIEVGTASVGTDLEYNKAYSLNNGMYIVFVE